MEEGKQPVMQVRRLDWYSGSQKNKAGWGSAHEGGMGTTSMAAISLDAKGIRWLSHSCPLLLE